MLTLQERGWPRKNSALAYSPFGDNFPALSLKDKLDLSPTPPPDPDKPTPNSANNAVLKYTKQDFQQILQAVLRAKKRSQDKKPKEKSLNPCQLDVFQEKFYIKCYNFIQQCENYFSYLKPKDTIEFLLPQTT